MGNITTINILNLIKWYELIQYIENVQDPIGKKY